MALPVTTLMISQHGFRHCLSQCWSRSMSLDVATRPHLICIRRLLRKLFSCKKTIHFTNDKSTYIFMNIEFNFHQWNMIYTHMRACLLIQIFVTNLIMQSIYIIIINIHNYCCRWWSHTVCQVWNLFVPHKSQVSIYYNQSVVDSSSRTLIKHILK